MEFNEANNALKPVYHMFFFSKKIILLLFSMSRGLMITIDIINVLLKFCDIDMLLNIYIASLFFRYGGLD